ncbi:hypothetical protein GX411_04545 [Candidatus Fermentibacteria bacterium]|nr:hypothetical protein [Candidatus Fermentibacteria bacterium]
MTDPGRPGADAGSGSRARIEIDALRRMRAEWRSCDGPPPCARLLARRLHRARMDKPALDVLASVRRGLLPAGDRLLLAALLLGDCDLRGAALAALSALSPRALAMEVCVVLSGLLRGAGSRGE